MKTNLRSITRIARLAAGRWLLATALLCATGVRAADPIFTNVTATVGLTLGFMDVAWGDYDNDGRLDLLAGDGLWRNTGSGFTNVSTSIAPGLAGGGQVAWADYDKDGLLDFFHAGQLWRNTGSRFTNVTAAIAPGMIGGAVAWGDYDNDGRLDLIVSGSFMTQIWRNTGNGFVNVTATVAPGLRGIQDGSVAWGDYDNDGRLDFIITGGIPRRSDLDDNYPYYTPFTQIWRNTGNGFANVTATVAPGLPGAFWSTVAWGDYDNDGRLDFLLAGYNGGAFSQIWRNTGNGFVNVTPTVAPGLPGVIQGPVAWGDYDGDGLPDILLSGYIWRNTGSGFTNVTASLAPGLSKVVSSSLAWGDYDGDGRLDFALAGSAYFYCDGCDAPPFVFQLWQNNTVQTTPPPGVITELPAGVTQSSMSLNARINPRGQAASAWFVWGNSTNYGHATAAQPMGNGNSFTNFSHAITGLSTGVTYYYRAVGSNNQGQVYLGFEQLFTLAAPGVATAPGESFSPTVATFRGQAYANNLPAYGWFEWGLSPAYGQVTPVRFLGNGWNIPFAEIVSSIQSNTTYYFRAVASNSLGVAYGGGQSVTTPFMDVCQGSLSPTSRSHASGGGANSVYVLLQCDWFAINTNSWITILSPTNGGAWGGSLTYTVAPNNLPVPRSGNITIGGHNFTVNQAIGQPVLIVQPPEQTTLGGGAAAFSVAVTGAPPAMYQWQFNGVPLADGNGISGASTSYLELTGVQYSQAGYYRLIVMDASGSPVGFSSSSLLTVSCGFTLTSGNAGFSSLSATGQVALHVGAPDCPWNIVNTNSWVTILSGINNKGNGTVVYALAENPTTLARSGSILIADQVFAISQAGGTFANTPLSLAEALDTSETLSWSTVGTPAWFGQTLFPHDGVDAAQSGPLGHDDAVTAQITVAGPGTISFWWKVSSETNNDYLKFFINGLQQTRISGEEDWQQQTFAVPSGGQVLKWTYSKNYGGTAGQDRGWLDQVQFVPSNPCNLALSPTNRTHDSTSLTGLVSISTAAGCDWTVVNTNDWLQIVSGASGTGNGVIDYLLNENPGPLRSGNLVVAGQLFTVTQLAASTNATISLAEALDTVGTSLVWDTIGAPAWFGQTSRFGQTSFSHDGLDAAQSGAVDHNGAVTVYTTVEGPGAISFWWKVSSEFNKDYLKFFINGVQQTRISGEVNWESQRYIVPAGTQVFKWTYSKNATGSEGLDRGWVDQVHFLPGAGECVMTLSHTAVTHSFNSDTGQVNVFADPGCTWGVVNTNSWITPTVTGGEGNGFIRYTLAANNLPANRTGVLTIAGQPFTISQLGGPCLYSISPASRTHNYGGGTGLFSVTAQPGCGWNVSNNNTWITILSGANGSGSSQVIYSISQNNLTVARSGQIGINGQIFTVNQSGAPITLAESLDTVGTPLVWLTAGVGTWFGQSAMTHDGVDAAQSGAIPSGGVSSLQTTVTGPGTLTFWWKVSSYTNSNLRFFVGSSEQAHISGEVDWQQRTVAIPQGIYYLLWDYTRSTTFSSGQNCGWVDQVQFVPTTPCPVTLTPGNAAHPSGSSTGSLSVAAAPDCTWNVYNTNSWISLLSASSGTGNGNVTYSVGSNPSVNVRSGTMNIAGQNFLVTQAGSTNPPGCTFSISPTNRTHGSGSTTNNLAVITLNGCAWTVMTTNSWISILSSLNDASSGTVIYSLAANTSSQARTGNILIGGQNFVLTQFGTSQTNAPRLQFMSRTETNATLSVQGNPGKLYVVQSTEDLIHWRTLGTNTAPSTVIDATVGNVRWRFYRSLETP